jgi:hypothetical protein
MLERIQKQQQELSKTNRAGGGVKGQLDGSSLPSPPKREKSSKRRDQRAGLSMLRGLMPQANTFCAF